MSVLSRLEPARRAGGDNGVPRDSKGRPRIIVPCEGGCAQGKVPSPKTGNPINCSKCNGKAQYERSYTRVTTFIDVISDKSNLMKWKERNVLIGVALDPTLTYDVLDKVAEMQAEDTEVAKDAKNWLNRRAEVAADRAGASEKADKGTHLHEVSELIDLGKDVPTEGVSVEDILDMDSYRRATTMLQIVHQEKLVVLDEFKLGGTPDRISTPREGEILVAPDGHVFENGENLITDLKTGSVEHDPLKMAMQLAIYSRSKLYDKDTGERVSLGNINQSWGLIMNTPAGSGETRLFWADLEIGWRAVKIAREIRTLRTEGKRALIPFDQKVQVREEGEE